MVISSQLFESYLQCPTKCWLRWRAEQPTGNAYAEWLAAQNETYSQVGLKLLVAAFPECDCSTAPPTPSNHKEALWRLAVDLRWITNDLESHLQAVERVPANGRGTLARFIPYRFDSANRITKEHKLLLGFDEIVVSESLGRVVGLGKIVHGDNFATLIVKTAPLAREVRKRINEIAKLLTGDSPPDFVLNRHCGECEFQTRCRTHASEKDELSLLSGMSGKDRKKFHAKGVFTVTQLSYTFRPRRRPNSSRDKPEKYHHSLRALAIRENKIHVVSIRDLKPEGTLVFLDVEGISDRDFYYLIGIRVEASEGGFQHSFWAENDDEEKLIWNNLLGVLSKIINPRIVDYGNYETIFLKRMRARYGGPPEGSQGATALDHSINLLTFIYAHVYFPTYSNGLKEIAGFIGFQWSGRISSGIETILWRRRWEESGDRLVKQTLIDYNRQDCESLELVTKRLIDLHSATSSDGRPLQREVVLTSTLKWKSPYGLGNNQFAILGMEIINKAAYWDYQRDRVYVKSANKMPRKRKRLAITRGMLKPNTTIEHSRKSPCPKRKSEQVYGHGKQVRTAIDLRFTGHGIKRWIARHRTQRYRCASCKSTFYPLDTTRPLRKYGPNLSSYIVYLIIELRLSLDRVTSHIRNLFHIPLWNDKTYKFKTDAAESYRSIYNKIIVDLCSGKLLHADETTISVKGTIAYVWVLTSMEKVAYFYTPTRESNVIQTLLAEFKGVLVSDFYTAYDAINCPQQKCLIHFIRDLNDDLLKFPYDDGLKVLAKEFTELVKPMIETVGKYGLKRRFLAKHSKFVDHFYKRLSGEFGHGEPVRKIIERLRRNRDTMFTFLNYDDVPWNNNNAEHAVKAFAKLREVFDGNTTVAGLRDYLVLLSICETCKYKNVDFLEFLRSGSKDIDKFGKNPKKALHVANGPQSLTDPTCSFTAPAISL